MNDLIKLKLVTEDESRVSAQTTGRSVYAII